MKNTVSSQRGSKHNDDGGNPIAAKPLRAMGLLAFYRLFLCRAGILHYAAPPVRLGLVDAQNRRTIFWDFIRNTIIDCKMDIGAWNDENLETPALQFRG